MIRYSILLWKIKTIRNIQIKDGKLKKWPKELGTPPTLEELATWGLEYIQYLREKRIVQEEEKTRVAAEAQAINDNLPSWAAVNQEIINIANLVDAKAFIRKLSRVVYWLVKDKAD